MKNPIIAIVGMCGSGKSVASDFFKTKDYQSVYFGGVTIDQLKQEGIEVTPANEQMMREKLRQEYGMGAYATILLPQIEAYHQTSSVVLDGLYSWDELKILNKKFHEELIVISIVVDKHIRYERLKTRPIRPLSKEEARNRDIAEIDALAKGGPIAYADYYISNNGTLEEYHHNLEEILNKIERNLNYEH